jgi:hypothetical protein
MRETDTPERTDPKGLIRDSYRIEGITPGECRSIFLDWAIGLPAGRAARDVIPGLLAVYGTDAPDHPMTAVLTQGLENTGKPARRGGHRSRTRPGNADAK